MKLRVIMSVILGCDVCPGGVKKFGPSKVHQKLTKIRASSMAALRSWTHFASYNEDLKLHDESKWGRYNGYRPIIWDMTNVSAFAFSDASLQRATYSDYYGENCFKGGVFCQLCGWLVGE